MGGECVVSLCCVIGKFCMVADGVCVPWEWLRFSGQLAVC